MPQASLMEAIPLPRSVKLITKAKHEATSGSFFSHFALTYTHSWEVPNNVERLKLQFPEQRYEGERTVLRKGYLRAVDEFTTKSTETVRGT